MSIVQELESIFGITFEAPFDFIVVTMIIFFFFAMIFNFIKLLFRLFKPD